MAIGVSLIINNFEFLKGIDDNCYKLALEMEENVYSSPAASIQTGGNLFESLLELTLDEACIKKTFGNAQDKINELYDCRVLDYKVKGLFDRTRKSRNKAVHNKGTVLNSLKLCENVHAMAVWIFNRYFNFDDVVVPDYEEPKPLNPMSVPFQVQTTIKEETNIKNEEETREEVLDNFDDFNLEKLNGSYLINELSKLSISSKHSVEDAAGLDEFKEYMHVEREIQKEFHNTLLKVKDNNSNQLILLAGSVGDGKSHLLAYMTNKYPEIMKEFTVHNDATISFDPNLTAIDTLREVLKPFNDKSIDTSKDKIILAINLGIIRGLLDDEKFGEEFSKLKDILDKSDIFNSSLMESKVSCDFLDIINFSDNHLFELFEGRVDSEFLTKLFENIVCESDDNPFYMAYLKDKQEGIVSPVTLNYEMFKNEEVRAEIIQTVLKYIIKNKKLLSTREIINFIYEILVPAEIDIQQDMSKVNEYIDDLLPIMLFNTKNRSKMLKEISEDSPIDIRSEYIDNYLISLNTSEIEQFFNNYFNDYSEMNFFKNNLLSYDYLTLKKKEKRELNDKLIYFAIFFGNDEFKQAFKSEKYEEFLKFLYYYNNNPKELNRLVRDIRDSIFKWKGQIKKEYLLIDDFGEFQIGKKAPFVFKNDNVSLEYENNNRFKTEIVFNVLANQNECLNKCGATCNDYKCVKLNIDYFLFDSIIKISNGYQPNKLERQNLLVFDDFIKSLIKKNKSDEILIKDCESGDMFKFKEDYGQYSFERE